MRARGKCLRVSRTVVCGGRDRTGGNRHYALFRIDSAKFTMIFLDSDSVTNVTSLNRVNKRRVLIYIGNGRGMISFGKGKGEDYE